MEPIKTLWADVDDQGRLVLPPEVVEKMGVRPGARLRLEESDHHIRLHRPVTHLNKIYLEPTNGCNLECRTCMRNAWEESIGRMSEATFQRFLDSLKKLPSIPTVFFGGLGEPLYHPRTPEWVSQIKRLGARVELITNGTLLNEKTSQRIIEAGLDVLWVSLDGATPESYADVRLGAELPQVLENLKRFRRMRRGSHRPTPAIGIAFVAMKRNIADLPALLRLGKRVDAKYFSVSNVLPYTEEFVEEKLYDRSIKNIAYLPSPWLRKLSLPKMDLDEYTSEAFLAALNSGYNVNFAGNNLGGANDVCIFIESGAIAVGWQGDVSPCPPLLHTHVSYLHGKPRFNLRHVVGNIAEQDLLNIWNDPEYEAYRTRVQSFAFAPCTYCGGCDMSEGNLEDCFSLPHPACGGCLWAQGVIQCP